MKFATILAFAALAVAVPAPIHEERQVTVVGTVVEAATNLQAAVDTNAGAIVVAVGQITTSITAEVEAQIKATLIANLSQILVAITVATKTVVEVTLKLTAQVLLGVTVLAQAEIDNLTAAVKIVISVLVKLQATLTVTLGNLEPATKAFLAAEIVAIKAALSPFIGPFLIYVDAVIKNSASVGVTLEALIEAQAQLVVVVKAITTSLGIPEIST